MTKRRISRHDPLISRTFRLKNPAKEFFCPLCSTKRAFTISPRLQVHNYFQISMMSIFLAMICYPLMEWRGVFFFFPVWIGFEASVRILFRREIPCPHCGFDASWYQRDVKVTRRLVQEFWDKQAVDKSGPTLDEAAENVDQLMGAQQAEAGETASELNF